MELYGYQLAFLEILSFYGIVRLLKTNRHLDSVSNLIYYWMTFTIMTGIWEFFFVLHYSEVNQQSQYLLTGKEHVWTNVYSASSLNPRNFSVLFYSEYGAYADRMYMTSHDTWSRVIESSHAMLCGIFCLLALCYRIAGNQTEYFITLSVGMGAQLMNSILYLFNYFHEVKDKDSVNYNSPSFPCGKLLQHRLFMYVNVFWFLMPYLVIRYLVNEFSSQVKENQKKLDTDILEKYPSKL